MVIFLTFKKLQLNFSDNTKIKNSNNIYQKCALKLATIFISNFN